MSWRIGVDIGGTFIDFCVLDDATQQMHTLKVLTTPDEPGREVMEGVALLQARHGMAPAAVTAFVHGTTVGINTVIQRKGAALALLTNAGFEDVIEMARLRMPEMYSLFCARPEQLIPRDRIFGVAGRVLADGREAEPLDAAAVRAAARQARARGAEGIIISFLHSYRNAAQEEAAEAVIRAAEPGLFVFRASGIWPVIREYERTTTAILNGYVHPRVDRYLDNLGQVLAAQGITAAPMITKSNGGVMGLAEGRTSCVGMLLSGTASGVMGAAFLARQAGLGQVLTLDIGGTSADVALIIDGQPQFGTGEMIGDFPLHVPSVSVTSIGDGGGSIASVDGFGMLRVGPESAGSTPGPACYGRGGTRATITDAMAVLGFLGHAPLAYRSVTMDRAKAEAVVGALARRLGRGLQETAEAIIQVSISSMFAEVNKLVARHGVDARDFTLLPFGGAGPMMGCLLARELGMARVMIPRRPGVVSALGGLIADVKNDFVRTLFIDLVPEAMPALAAALAELRARATRWLRDEQGFTGEAAEIVSAEMRYRGQSFEIEVPLEAERVMAGDTAALHAAFDRRHAGIYDFADPAAPVQLVNLRLVILGRTPPPVFPAQARVAGTPAPQGEVTAFLDGAARAMPLYWRDDLRHGHRFAGPAIVAQEDTTLCIPPGFDAEVDAHGHLHLTAA
ncbi:hydantoinase/oxoprolinase family protein [Roseomonas sp. GC11]|uniref:hydantoinase/oxoprolinase family protein n=1 Tax=Roseomonas sp. GC11 TaxID=2950546 RepID=UPI00210E5707|nr:hydantoinase/oxoprolinase family protein [Roseomonas sp. GC11]MCQ4159528.1 hydantoinase/oxoprolinase family protein [Roseomonas sp. GC11]